MNTETCQHCFQEVTFTQVGTSVTWAEIVSGDTTCEFSPTKAHKPSVHD